MLRLHMFKRNVSLREPYSDNKERCLSSHDNKRHGFGKIYLSTGFGHVIKRIVGEMVFKCHVVRLHKFKHTKILG